MKKKNVAIVGAGAAGLMAALELRDAGHDVLVFEARNRVGGRIHTVHFEDGRFANAGAEWLNSSDETAMALVARYSLDLVPNSGFEALVADGRPFRGEHGYPMIDAALDAAVESITNLENPWNDPAARDLDRVSVAEWTFRIGADEATIHRFFQDMEGEFMAPVTEISMAAIALSSALTNDDRAFRLREGTSRLPHAMAEDLGDAVRLSEPVHAVHHQDGHVLVRTARGESAFDAAILALPLPVLSRMELDPGFDVPWIGQGRGGKLMVPFANTQFDSIGEPSPGTGIKFVYANAPHQPGDGTILTAYSRQPLGPTEVLAAFARWFPDLIESGLAPTAVWWDLDPHSGTTYSAPQPGYLDALRRLREPQSRVVLAGEHTEVLFGYVESALMSGRRAARVVNDLV